MGTWLKSVATWIGQHMGLPSVTDFELHFFTAATAVLALGTVFPGARIAAAVLVAALAGVKEMWFDPTFKAPGEPVRIGLRDFSYYAAGAAAAYGVFCI